MRRQTRGLAGALAALLSLAGCASKPPAAQSELDRISAAHTLRVCSTGDYRPFTYRDAAGQWSGMDIDLANDLAHGLGVSAVFVPTTWATLTDDLGRSCDLAMGGITVTPQRAEKALFSDPYLHDGKAAMVRCADATKYRSLADVDRPGVRVIVNPGGTNEQFDRTHLHRATIIGYPDNNTIFEQLINGAADVMITDGSEIRWQATQYPQLCGVSTDRPFTDARKAYLMPKPATALQRRVNDWLRDIARDGTYAEISRRWLGAATAPN